MIDMYPLDFEEFLWANGISPTVIDSVKSCFENETVVPEGVHKAMMELLYRSMTLTSSSTFIISSGLS